MKRKVYFRADAGHDLGYGHFIRSLALADMLREDFDCTFFTVAPTEYQCREAASVCPLVALPDDWTALDKFLNLLRGDEIVVLDNYFYTLEYQKAVIGKGCRLVCVDDMHSHPFAASLIISHFISDPSRYELESADTRLLMGLRWAMLRRPFRDGIFPEVRRYDWTVCFGGSDPYGLTSVYAARLAAEYPEARIAVVTGDAYRSSVPQGVDRFQRLDAQSMASLFKDSSRVVCSASTICCEALSCGCEVFAGYYVDNQHESYRTFAEGGYIHPLGDLLAGNVVPLKSGEPLSRLEYGDLEARYRSLFMGLSLDVFNYTDLSEARSRKVWEARNDVRIRERMVNSEPFSFESHCRFVDALRSDGCRKYFAFFDGDEFVGSYDFVGIRDGDRAERGLYVSPQYWHKGIASAMEALMDGEIIKRGVRILTAEVLKTNEASIRYHRSAGYRLTAEDGKYYYLERKI